MVVIRLRPNPNPNWLQLCIRTNGRNPVPISNLANALIGLENDPGLLNSLAFDEFAQKIVLLHEIGDPNTVVHREASDNDVATIQDYLQHAGIKQLGKDTAHQAVEHYASRHGFHPVRDHLSQLQWDHTARVDTWLPTYAGTASTDYEMQIGQMFLVSMVARIYQPGCKADYMPVLEGEQGKLKSTLFDKLAQPWFSDDLPADISQKDAKQHLRGKWLIEVAEMHAFSKAEATQLKSFLSRKVEKYRPPFGRIEVSEPRQCVFAGTTNKTMYLRDETGGRRFWPLAAVNKIDIAGMERDRDQLLAEAVTLYRAGAKWYPAHAFEEKFIKPQQDARYEADEWTEKISEYLDDHPTLTETTAAQIANAALGFGDKTDRLGTREGNRIRAVLSQLGWEIGPRGHGGIRKWIKTGRLI